MRDPRLLAGTAAILVAAIASPGRRPEARPRQQDLGSSKSGSGARYGTANGQFRNPFGLATDKAGNLYVADTDNNRIQVFSAAGAFVRKWGTAGNGNGQFQSAQDVAISPDGSVWVADYRNDRLQQFDSGGGFKQAVAIDRGPSGVGIDCRRKCRGLLQYRRRDRSGGSLREGVRLRPGEGMGRDPERR